MITATATVPAQRMPEPQRTALRVMLLDHVAAASTSPDRARSSMRHLVVPVVASAAVLGAGGAVAYSQLGGSTQVSDQHTARCYSSAIYTAGDNFPGTTIGVPDTAAGQGNVTNAVDVCASLWRAGILQIGASSPIARPTHTVNPVPGLVECVLPDGRAAVFPGAQGLCSHLGLRDALVK